MNVLFNCFLSTDSKSSKTMKSLQKRRQKKPWPIATTAKGHQLLLMKKWKIKTIAEHPLKNSYFYQCHYNICLEKIYHFVVSLKYSKLSLMKKVACPRSVSCSTANGNLGILTHLQNYFISIRIPSFITFSQYVSFWKSNKQGSVFCFTKPWMFSNNSPIIFQTFQEE